MEKSLNLGRLRRFRKEVGLSQATMARRLGYESQSGYANIENGRVALKADQAMKIAELVRRNVEELYDSEPARTISLHGKTFALVNEYVADSMVSGYAQFANADGHGGSVRIIEFFWYPNGEVEKNFVNVGPVAWGKISDMRE